MHASLTCFTAFENKVKRQWKLAFFCIRASHEWVFLMFTSHKNECVLFSWMKSFVFIS